MAGVSTGRQASAEGVWGATPRSPLTAASRRQVGAVLRACVTDGDVRAAIVSCSPDAVDWIPAAAEYHGISMTLYRELAQRPGAASELHDAMRPVVLDHVATTMRVREDLRRLAGVLDRSGLLWAVVKGPVLAEAFYGDVRWRSYVDLDLVVDPRQFGPLLDLLQDGVGAHLVDVNWRLVRESRRGELNLLLPLGSTLDLHWTLVNARAVRSQFAFPTAALLERTIRMPLSSGDIATLDLADTLLHLALHACLSGGYRLGWLLDIKRVVEAPGLDWDMVVRRARASRLDLVTGAMLARAQRVAGCPVPPDVLRAFGGAIAWRALLRSFEQLRPISSPYRLPLSGQSVTGSTRTNTWTSVAAAVELIATRRRTRSASGGGNPLHHAEGSAADRTAFLADIVADDASAAERVRHG